MKEEKGAVGLLSTGPRAHDPTAMLFFILLNSLMAAFLPSLRRKKSHWNVVSRKTKTPLFGQVNVLV